MESVPEIKKRLAPLFNMPPEEIEGFVVIVVTKTKLKMRHNASHEATIMGTFEQAAATVARLNQELNAGLRWKMN